MGKHNFLSEMLYCTSAEERENALYIVFGIMHEGHESSHWGRLKLPSQNNVWIPAVFIITRLRRRYIYSATELCARCIYSIIAVVSNRIVNHQVLH